MSVLLSFSVVYGKDSMLFTLSVCTVWRVFDVKVAGWLLNPDNPPVTFKQVLMPCQELQQVQYICYLV